MASLVFDKTFLKTDKAFSNFEDGKESRRSMSPDAYNSGKDASVSRRSSLSYGSASTLDARTLSAILAAYQRQNRQASSPRTSYDGGLQKSESLSSLPSSVASKTTASSYGGDRKFLQASTRPSFPARSNSDSGVGTTQSPCLKFQSGQHSPSLSPSYGKMSKSAQGSPSRRRTSLAPPSVRQSVDGSLMEIVETEEQHQQPSFTQSLSVEQERSGTTVTVNEEHAAPRKSVIDYCCGSLLRCTSDLHQETEYLKNEAEVNYHKVGLAQLCSQLHTDMSYGLTEAAVHVAIKNHGPNKIRPPPTLPEWLKFCKNLVNGFCILLWIGSALCFVAYGMQRSKNDEVPNDNLYLGCVLAGVVLLTACFSYYQEAASSKIMESYERVMPSYATVIRGGREQRVPVEVLVPGDIVLLKAGDKIPAHCRIIKSINFKVDNSAITGESEPQPRTPDCTNDNPLESKNIIFFSTFAVEGTATAIVVATGDHTFMGRMTRLTTGLKQKQTPISRELDIFVYIICVFAASLGIMFVVWFLVLNPERWIDAVVLFIGVVMGVLPSGVLIEVALCLTLAAKRMAQQKAIVKNLEAVETLGSTTTICSDKTGTLTRNNMTVTHLWFSDEIHIADTSKGQIVGKKYKADGEITGWTSLIRIAALCSRAAFKPNQYNVDVMARECIGDGTESGLLKFVERSVGSIDEFRARWPKIIEMPFTSTAKYQVSVHRRFEDGRFLVVMKGAPEKVFDMCSMIYIQGEHVFINKRIRDKFNKVYSEMADQGERVLGFAELLLPTSTYPPDFHFKVDREPNFPIAGLRFIGLISMMDPPRAAVPGAVRKCRQAGIRVVMVTGDHPLTAKSIARMVGIIGPHSKTREDIAKERSIPVSQVDPRKADAIVISGDELRKMTNEQLDAVIARYKEIVFARTSPQQKLNIVEGFQRAGDIVAVTGDGANDSPALKQADIGIAMGISGSDVSKQGADMILMDDNFATIVFAIEDGRKMFDNLKKTVCYIMSGNEAELAAPLAAVALGIPLPMSTIAMLVLSLLTDMVPAVMLAYEEAEDDVMKRKPRNAKTESLVNRRLIFVSMGMYGVVEVCAGFFAYFVVMAESGFLPKDVWGIRDKFDDPECNSLVDSYGQEWTYSQRKALQYTLYAVYLLAVVEMQWITLLVYKASRSHLFQQSWQNHYLYFGIGIETCVVALLCYCPGVNEAFGLAPLLGRWWLIALPWGLMLVGVDQLRKLLIRRGKRPNSFGRCELLY